MHKLEIRTGIQEAVAAFWEHVDRHQPLIFPERQVYDKEVVGEALLIALGKLNRIRDETGS